MVPVRVGYREGSCAILRLAGVTIRLPNLLRVDFPAWQVPRPHILVPGRDASCRDYVSIPPWSEVLHSCLRQRAVWW